MIDKLVGGSEVGGEVGDPVANGLQVGQPGAEGAAAHQVFAGQLQAPVRAAEREDRRDHTFKLETTHELVKAAAQTAEDVVEGHSHGVEAHGRRIGGAPTDRLGPVDRDPGAVGIDHEQREPRRATAAAGLGAAACEDDEEVPFTR